MALHRDEEREGIEVDEAAERAHRFDELSATVQRQIQRSKAQQYLVDAAGADTHSSDVDPGCVDPWSER